MAERRSAFKVCSNCNKVWESRADFLMDAEVRVVGYQANFVALEKGLFLFNHSCQSTLSFEAHVFKDLYPGPIYQERVLGSEFCAGYCLHRNILHRCPEKCECGYVREVLQYLKNPPQA